LNQILSCNNQTNLTNHSTKNNLEVNNEKENFINDAIIIDDIMYLKSMRKKIFALFNCSNEKNTMLTIYIKANLQTALIRNSSRDGNNKLENKTIENIYNSFESPIDSKFFFDKNSICVENNNEWFNIFYCF
jgi:tRNA uridine 5-carbamoylmethylation protein Kti12